MILLGIGGNLATVAGDPRRTVLAALEALADAGVDILRRSSLYASAPVGVADQPEFVNAVAEIAADGPPEAVLDRLQRVEARFGRARRRRWQARTLDLDLLDWNGRIRPDRESWERARTSEQAPATLILPHPRMHERRFVLEPLAEFAPAWRHPVLYRTASELLAEVQDQPVRRLDKPCA